MSMPGATLPIFRKWADVVGPSRPSRKPQLWEDIGFYARRRLAYSLAAAFAPASLERPRLVRLRRSGILIEILPRRYVGQSIFLYGVWEIVGTRLMELLLRPGMSFIDVGANVGYYSLLAAKCVGPQGRVISFEPHPMLRAMLERGVQANGFTNICIRPEAVTASSGAIELYVFSEANEGVSSTIPHDGVEQHPVVVPAISLDDLLLRQQPGPTPRVDVIKIDVEGAEADVFAGMRGLLGSPLAPSAILFETSAVCECADLLSSFGYDVMGAYFSLGKGLEFIPIDDTKTIRRLMADFRGQPTLDYLALRRGHAPDTFASLTERSRRRVAWPWRLLQHWT